MSRKPKASLLALCFASLLFLPTLTSAQQPFYKVWMAGGMGDQDSAVTNEHSALVGWMNNPPLNPTDVLDTDFAAAIAKGVSNNNGYKSIPLVFVFGQCFSGGMLDELNSTFNDPVNYPNIQLSALASTKYNEFSFYPKPGGNGFDFIYAYNQTMRQPDLRIGTMAAQAAQNDPWGPAPSPPWVKPPRLGETQSLEQPWYLSLGMVDKVPFAPQKAGKIVLWSGQPMKVDSEQFAQLVGYVAALGYGPGQIVILFGPGGLDPNLDPLAIALQKVFKGKFNAVSHLREANPTQLGLALSWAFPVNGATKFLFFMANDHGFNNVVGGDFSRQMPAWGGGPIYPGSYGGGNSPSPIY